MGCEAAGAAGCWPDWPGWPGWPAAGATITAWAGLLLWLFLL